MIGIRWRKVLRDLWDNKSRTILAIMSIAVGIIAFGGLFTARNLMLVNIDVQYLAANDYDIAIELSPFDDALVRWATRQDGITAAQGITIHEQDLIINGVRYDVTLHSFEDFNDIAIHRIEPEEGAFPPGREEILIERSFLSEFDLELGESVIVKVDDESEYRVRVVGSVHDVNIQPGFIADRIMAYATPRTVNRMGLSADFNTLYLNTDRRFFATDVTEKSDEIRDELQRLGYTIRSVTVNQEREHWSSDNVSGLAVIFVIVGFLALMLSAFLVVNTISGLLAQQRKQVGMMKIIGASQSQIIAIYLVMVGSLGLFALVIAVPASAFVARQLITVMGPNTINFDIEVFYIPVAILALEVVVAILAPLLAGLGPVLSGARISAAAAISDYVATSRNNRLDVLLARIRGLPRPLILSLRNTFRRKVRLVLTMITLVMAGALFIAIFNVRTAVQTDVQDILRMSKADLQVSLMGRYDRIGMERRALTVDGTVSAQGWLTTPITRIREGNVESENFNLFGIPHDSIHVEPLVLEGRWLSPLNEFTRNEIVLGSELLKNEPDLEIGDIVTTSYLGEEEEWELVGIVWALEVGGGDGTAYAHYDTVAEYVDAPDTTNMLMINTASSTQEFQARVQSDLITYFDNQDVEIRQTDISSDQIQALLDAFSIIITMLMITAAMVAVVGGLGLAGTMSLSVLERTREVGVMRSVGASNNIIRLIFITEGIIIGLLSFLVSMMLSVPSTYALATILGNVVREDPYSTRLDGTSLLIWLGIVLVVSALASLVPAQRAAQISIREALAYE